MHVGRSSGADAATAVLSPDGKLAALHQRLQPLGARHRDRRGQATDDRRRQGLRLRHRQRRLDAAAIARCSSGRRIRRRSRPSSRISARPARCISSTRPPAIRRCRAWKYPLPGDERHHDDRARRHRGRRPEGDSPEDGPGPAPLDALRRRASAAASGSTCSGIPTAARSRSSRRRAITSRPTCASPMPAPARSARCSKKRARPSSNPATAASTGAICPVRTKRSGFRSTTTGASSICTICRPARSKHPITSGEGNVTQLLRVDETDRMLYFQGVGKERGRDPYFRHFYRASMDGKPPQLLTPEDADHDISLSPSGRYFVDNYSKPDVPSTSVLRDRDRQDRCCRWRRWTSAGCSRPAGSRRCRSR